MKYKTKVDLLGYNFVLQAGAISDEAKVSNRYWFVNATHSIRFEKKFVESHPEFFEPVQEPWATDEDMKEFARTCCSSNHFQTISQDLRNFKFTRGIKD